MGNSASSHNIVDTNVDLETTTGIKKDLVKLRDDVNASSLTLSTKKELQTVQSGVIEDALRKTNMTPEQVRTNASLLKTVGIGAAVFFGIRWLWKGSGEGDKSNFGTRALTLVGTLIGGNMLSQALTGKSAGDMVKQIVNGKLTLTDVLDGKTNIPESRRGSVALAGAICRDIPYPMLAKYAERQRDDNVHVNLSALSKDLFTAYTHESNPAKQEQLRQQSMIVKQLLDEPDGNKQIDNAFAHMGITVSSLRAGRNSDTLNTLLAGRKEREGKLAAYEAANDVILKNKNDKTVLAYLQTNYPSLQSLIADGQFIKKQSLVGKDISGKNESVDDGAAGKNKNETVSGTIPLEKTSDVTIKAAADKISDETREKVSIPSSLPRQKEQNDKPIIVAKQNDLSSTTQGSQQKTVADEPLKTTVIEEESPIDNKLPLSDDAIVQGWTKDGVKILEKHNHGLYSEESEYIDIKTSHIDIRGKGWYALVAHDTEVYIKEEQGAYKISMPHNKTQISSPVEFHTIDDALKAAHFSAYITYLYREQQKPAYIAQQYEKYVSALSLGSQSDQYKQRLLSIDK